MLLPKSTVNFDNGDKIDLVCNDIILTHELR